MPKNGGLNQAMSPACKILEGPSPLGQYEFTPMVWTSSIFRLDKWNAGISSLWFMFSFLGMRQLMCLSGVLLALSNKYRPSPLAISGSWQVAFIEPLLNRQVLNPAFFFFIQLHLIGVCISPYWLAFTTLHVYAAVIWVMHWWKWWFVSLTS